MNFLFSLMSISLVANLTVQERCEHDDKEMVEKNVWPQLKRETYWVPSITGSPSL